MKRILEPELMIDPAQVTAYSNADFSASNQAFVDSVAAAHPDFTGTILDIGCGPGDVTLMLADALPHARVLAIDGSSAMLAEAERKRKMHTAADHVEFQEIYLPSKELTSASFDIIISKDLLHHLPEPAVLWNEIARLMAPNASSYIMDLRRPQSLEDAQELVRIHAANAPSILKEDFLNSLLAAFIPEEIIDQLDKTSFKYTLDPIGDRHLFITLKQ